MLEQLDGVDLQALAHGGEARRLADGAFETARAITAGQQVAGEVVNNAPDRVRSAGASMWRALRRAVATQRAQRDGFTAVERRASPRQCLRTQSEPWSFSASSANSAVRAFDPFRLSQL